MHTIADMGLVVRKSVSEDSNQVRFKPNCLATAITVLPAKSDSDIMFCLQSYHELMGAQWLSGRVLDSRPKCRGFNLTSVNALWSLSKTH